MRVYHGRTTAKQQQPGPQVSWALWRDEPLIPLTPGALRLLFPYWLLPLPALSPLADTTGCLAIGFYFYWLPLGFYFYWPISIGNYYHDWIRLLLALTLVDFFYYYLIYPYYYWHDPTLLLLDLSLLATAGTGCSYLATLNLLLVLALSLFATSTSTSASIPIGFYFYQFFCYFLFPILLYFLSICYLYYGCGNYVVQIFMVHIGNFSPSKQTSGVPMFHIHGARLVNLIYKYLKCKPPKGPNVPDLLQTMG
jgi:hypothetical protein